MTAAEVTVVIPTRDRRTFLARCLGTVLEQTGVDVEVIVVDDGSRDGTPEWIRSLADDRIRVVAHPSPRGVSAARNTGLAVATRPWVAFVDDDDLWAPSKLALQLEAIKSSEGAQWACVGQVTLNDKLRIVDAVGPPAALDEPILPLLANNVVPGGGSGVVAALNLVRDVGGFDERLSLIADWDLWIRLAQEAPATSVNRPLLGYVRHTTNMSWDVSHIGDEFEIVEAKYADIRASLGVWPNTEAWLNWIADAQRQAGRRRPAITADAHAAIRGKSIKPIVRAVVTGVSPHAWIAVRDRRNALGVRADWKREAEQWLAPIRAASGIHRHQRTSGADGELPSAISDESETNRCSSLRVAR